MDYPLDGTPRGKIRLVHIKRNGLEEKRERGRESASEREEREKRNGGRR